MIKRNKRVLDNKETSFANIMLQLRKEYNLTQKEVADIAGVSNRTVSKWETGSSVPDYNSIQKLCETLGVSPSVLILSKKTIKDKLKGYNKSVIKLFKCLFHNIFFIIFLIVFILLLVYFLNNFNNVRVYNIMYESDNIYFNHGYFFQTKKVNILTIDNVKLTKVDYEPTSVKVELYIYHNGDKYVLYEADTIEDIFIEEKTNNPNLITKDIINNLKKSKIYLDIYTTDIDGNEYTYNSILTLSTKTDSNSVAYHEIDNYLQEKELYVFSIVNKGFDTNPDIAITSNTIESNNDINTKMESLGFYDEGGNVYYKETSDGAKLEFDMVTECLKYTKINSDFFYSIIYNKTTMIVYSKIFSNINGETIMDMKYFLNTKRYDCEIGDCEKYLTDIDKINDIYQVIITTLNLEN